MLRDEDGFGDSGSASGGQVTVEMWDYLSGETANDSINAAIAEFEKANPDIKVKRTTFAFADLSKSILQGSVGGQVPDVAVVDVSTTRTSHPWECSRI